MDTPRENNISDRSEYFYFDSAKSNNILIKTKNIFKAKRDSYNNSRKNNHRINYNNSNKKKYLIKNETNKNEEKDFSVSFNNILLNKTFKSMMNKNLLTLKTNKNKANNYIKLEQKRNEHINKLLTAKYKKGKKNSLESKGQQTCQFDYNNNPNTNKNSTKFRKSLSAANLLTKKDIDNLNNELNNSKEKTDIRPLLQKNKRYHISYSELSYNGNQSLKNIKCNNRRFSLLNKTSINKIKKKKKRLTSSLISIEHYQRKYPRKKVDLSSLIKTISCEKFKSRKPENFYIHKTLNTNKSDRNKLKPYNIFPQIVSSILKVNEDKNENVYSFKIHKPSNINVFTMLELNKKSIINNL